MGFIKKDIQAPNPDVQREEPAGYSELARQLASGDPAERRWAARGLARHAESVPILLECLALEGDVSVREVILTTLTRIGTGEAVAGLVDCMRNDDAELRNEAIEAMKALPDEMAPIMGVLLMDHDPDVRILSVNILESLRHPGVESWLIDVIDNDHAVNVCATAVDLLGEVGSHAARDALLRLKRRFADEPYIQFAADLALNRIAKA